MSEAVALTAPRPTGRVMFDPVDVHVGRVIRARRLQVGLTQDSLAMACGVSFQQIQKYENGANRVSCSMLARIATALQASPAEFFPNPAAPADGDALKRLYALAASRQGQRLVNTFLALTERSQESVLNVISAILVAETEARGAPPHDA